MQGVGRMSLCLFHGGPIVMEDYKEYGIEEILNSKFTRRKRILPSHMERVIRWSYNYLDAVECMSWIAPISFANSISVTLTSRCQGGSVSLLALSTEDLCHLMLCLAVSSSPLRGKHVRLPDAPRGKYSASALIFASQPVSPTSSQCSLFLSQSPAS